MRYESSLVTKTNYVFPVLLSARVPGLGKANATYCQPSTLNSKQLEICYTNRRLLIFQCNAQQLEKIGFYFQNYGEYVLKRLPKLDEFYVADAIFLAFGDFALLISGTSHHIAALMNLLTHFFPSCLCRLKMKQMFHITDCRRR